MNGIGRDFVKMTKFQYLGQTDEEKGLPQPPLELEYDKTKRIIDLPDPKQFDVTVNLRETIENRRSVRKYSERPLTMEELSFLLWCTQGVKRVSSRPSTARTVPSAGARHAFETCILANNVTGLRPGLYRYVAIGHRLVEENISPGMADEVTRACRGQEFVKASAATFIWVAVTRRMTWRYGERGYRYMFLDAGHVCQNLYLSAQAIDCGVCALAAFSDDDMNSILGLDGEELFVIYMATVGKK
ncbi:SagB/ThcOx family dehydrogenase [Thermoanaerobacterium sp. DL9XJH110]|uniref:SagB/ThcOx family dehydrogenase n=1 Tax=Thermoanaerobacterium sp. DL9XJH110 TaxID=3386643 RepID=UPI003BB7781D